MPFPDPLDFDFHPLGDYETEERGGGGREKKKMSRNTVDEFPFVGQETSTPASSSPLVASSRGEKNMRNIIQELGTGEREQGGGGRGRKLARGEWGEEELLWPSCARARARVCVWDECQNVAPPDEWNKGSEEMESNYASISSLSSPAFRFLPPDPLANIIRRIGRRTTFIKLRATARAPRGGGEGGRPRTVSITGFLGFRFLFRSSIKSMPPRSKTSASRLSSPFFPFETR